MATCFIQTPLGIAQIVGDDMGVSSIVVLDQGIVSNEIPFCLQAVVQQLNQYFEGTLQQFDLVLNPKGTDFQKKIWDLLSEIPFGKTLSYMQLSHQFGDPKAIRAVAAANGKNPLWIVVPCHRVIGTNGKLVGYAGGLHRKKWLLNHENPQQTSLF
ncbi:methylated-DNA--[protein]-cysteine S-methyltransferase [Flavobacterium branchiophilum]|uniref:Methylated-DNA--protein-cysteine methyltransferase n=1 Tax=Flavobacterium branchiophilum TaxID=55197 RepID=A0A2H3KD05_9FLAO|nr:methylated-DNA--[protein]-cysteine S-methyltransferase [Flavobacterium branchiophilum]PDS25453.1 cysteine methyltransferase [Flavobacterium branchiophilum]